MGTKLERSYINLTTGEAEEAEVDITEDDFEDEGFAGIDDDDDWLEGEDDNGAILIAMLVGIIVVALFGICCLFSGNKDED